MAKTETAPFPLPDYGREIGRIVQAHRQRSDRRRLCDAGIPARYRACAIDNYVSPAPDWEKSVTAARNRLRTYLAQADKGGIGVIVGGPGSGKTHLAVASVRHFLERGYEALFTTKNAFLARFRDAEDDDSQPWRCLERMKRIRYLAIDDISVPCAGVSFERSTSLLLEVICYRFDNLLPTLLCVNHAIDAAADIHRQVAEALERVLPGGMVMDRVFEDGGALIVLRHGSYRMALP